LPQRALSMGRYRPHTPDVRIQIWIQKSAPGKSQFRMRKFSILKTDHQLWFSLK